MEGENPEGKFGVDHVETPDDVMGVDTGYGRTSSAVRHAEENPDKPLSSKGKDGTQKSAGSMLSSGEKDQPSDKDESSSEGWSNRTGGKAKMLSQAATGNVAGLSKEVKKNGGIKATAKKMGPIATIAIALLAGMGAFLGNQSLLLPSLVENLFLNYDSQNIITNIRSKIIFKMQMKGSIDANSKWADFTRHQKKKLANAGIEVETVRSGLKKYRVLKYTNSDGEVSYVAADADEAAKVKSKLGDVDVADFESKVKADNDFFVKYQDGTATWRTSVATMFDKVSDWVFNKLHITRNTYTDIEEKAPADGDYDAAKKAVDEDFDTEFQKATTGDTEVDATSHKKDSIEDEDTGETKTTVDDDSGSTKVSGDTEADVKASIEADDGAVAKAMDSDDIAGSGSSAAGVLSNIAEGTCQAYNIVNGMNRMIKAYEIAQIAVIGMKVLEAIQRMQAGDGGGDVIADIVGNMLTLVTIQKVKMQASSDKFGAEKFVNLEGSVMSSDAIGALYGGSQLTSNNAAVKALVVPESTIRRILNTIGTNSGTGYKVCSVANLAANAIDVVINIVSFGTAKLAGMLVGMAKGIVKGLVIAGLVAFFVPRIAKMLTRKFKEVVEGPIGGAALSWATSHVFSKNAQASGYRPARPDTLIKYAQLKQEVIADETRYAALTKSPFDTSSPYTFMGTILRTVGASMAKGNTLTSSINTFTNITAKSLNAFVPSSFAANKTVDELVSLGECTDLNTMNEGDSNKNTGDAFCEMVTVGDTTKNGTSPENVVKGLQDMTCTNSERGKKAFGDSFDPTKEDFDKNLTIEDDSCLSRFVVEYTQREAPLGEPDMAIADSYKASTGNTFFDMLASAVSFGLLDLHNSFEEVKHIPNTLGSEYTDPARPNAAYYNMAEQFIIQERMREAATGGEERSSVAVYLDKYYKEHPLDNSFEGILARYSGLSKKQVSFYLELGEEMTFLADYNPDGYYPLAYKHEDKTPKLEVEDDKPTNVFIVNVPYIILEVPIGKKNITA